MSGRMWKRESNLIHPALWEYLAHVFTNRFVQAASVWAVWLWSSPSRHVDFCGAEQHGGGRDRRVAFEGYVCVGYTPGLERGKAIPEGYFWVVVVSARRHVTAWDVHIFAWCFLWFPISPHPHPNSGTPITFLVIIFKPLA